MLKIRLQRVGRKHEPAFRLVLTDSKNSTKSGRFKEILGSYDARKSTDLIKTDRIKYWLDKGVALTGTVHNLLVSHKVLDTKKVNVLPKKTYVAVATDSAESPVVEAPVEEAKAEEPAPQEEAAPETSAETPAEAVIETSPEPTPETQEEVVESTEAPSGEAPKGEAA